MYDLVLLYEIKLAYDMLLAYEKILINKAIFMLWEKLVYVTIQDNTNTRGDTYIWDTIYMWGGM